MAKSTPMMEQYLKIKSQYPGTILFFRMGDFYEMFDEDAKVASKVLGVTLTSRSHGKGEKIPLAGVPHHAADKYLAKLINAGHKVAVCEQVEEPQRGKAVVKRQVVEVVTPGTTTSRMVLQDDENNYLVSVADGGKTVGLALIDLSTGEFLMDEVLRGSLLEELELIGPVELIVPEDTSEEMLQGLKVSIPNVTEVEGWRFAYDFALRTLLDHFQVVSLDGFGCQDLKGGIRAAGAALAYVQEMQRSSLVHIASIARRPSRDRMVIDPFTLRNLELISTIRGGDGRGTLFNVLNRTATAMGSRLLKQWIKRPLIEVDEIDQRLGAVEDLLRQVDIRENLRKTFRSMTDLERLTGRIGCGKANARDLRGLKTSLDLLPGIRESLQREESLLLKKLVHRLDDLADVCQLIEESIADDPPTTLTDGGLIRSGYNAELDELRQISHGGKTWIANLQRKERERTGIPSLKVDFNRVFGYYIEVTRPHLAKVPPDYVRKQTMVNAERFITPELKEYEAKVLGAEEKSGELEYRLFLEIRTKVAHESARILAVAKALAQVDVLNSLATVAADNHYVRPEVNDGGSIVIRDGRHPVVERMLMGEDFVPNDVTIDNDEKQIIIITGPNMAGKSTYLRQVGLIVLMAQIGSFVPARDASIGVVDRIFTRVGASDNVAQGQSTFLMEMNETANILNNATPRSLILLDEIGRGTSTFDGLSIAWAVTEYLHDTPQIAAKTLFATHYHELTELATLLPRVRNYQVAVREWNDQIIFLRKIVEGGCDDSYGIQVAQLAGLPRRVLLRAKEVLANLEEGELSENVPRKARGKHGPTLSDEVQLSLFSPPEHPVVDEIKKLDVTQMTPIEALNTLAKLVEKAKGDEE